MPGIRAIFIFTAVAVAASASAAKLDATYGSSASGRTVTAVEGKSADVRSALLQTDGKLVVVGASPIAGPGGAGPKSDMFVVRFNVDGSPDSSFGGDGVVTLDFAGGADTATAVIQQADGKLLVGGQVETADDFVAFVARFNADGSPDTGYGVEGRVLFHQDGPPEKLMGFTVTSLALQSTGRLVCLYGGYVGGSQLIRLLPSGQIDDSFDSELLPTGIRFFRLQALADDKLLLAREATGLNWYVRRLGAQGGNDTTFGNNGVAFVANVNTSEVSGAPILILPQTAG